MKTIFVSDLLDMDKGKTFEGVFRLKNPQAKKTNGGDPYILLHLVDKSGEILAKWWNRTEDDVAPVYQQPYVTVSGTADLYNGKKQIIVQHIHDWREQPECPEDYLPVAVLPVETLRERLNAHVRSVQSPPLKHLLEQIFGDPAFRKQFDVWPAAKRMHHACCHGLLQHTVEVTDLATAMADAQGSWGYRPLWRDLVTAGALLHDIGKVYEIKDDYAGNYSLTRSGEMLGHIKIGLQWLTKKMGKITDFPEEVRDALLHIIDSHHGQPEFGSPTPPMFGEAQIIHAADLLNVQLYYMDEVKASPSEDFVKVWQLDNRKVYTGAWSVFTASAEDVALEEMKPLLPPSRLPLLRFATDAANTEFHTRRLPLVGRAAAGEPTFSEQHVEGEFDVEDADLRDGEQYLLKVEGDSMTGDGIQDGDMIAVHRQNAVGADEIAAVTFDDSSEAAIKRVRQTAEGVALVSSNPAHAPIPVADPSTLRICGRVVGILRN